MWEEDDDENEMSDEEYRKEFEAEKKRVDNLPVTLIAVEIDELTEHIVGLVDPEKDRLMTTQYMREDALIIRAKIAGAEAGDLYNIRMSNAVIIKNAANSLLASTSMLKHEGLVEPHYLQLLRDEIEKFRLAFLDWINSFDKTNNINDGWGIFNEGTPEE
jgi:hypothetical protein